jgi:uncharacterized pyridoxal phosphate-containing UPF0001 family protein
MLGNEVKKGNCVPEAIDKAVEQIKELSAMSCRGLMKFVHMFGEIKVEVKLDQSPKSQ